MTIFFSFFHLGALWGMGKIFAAPNILQQVFHHP